VQDVQNPVLLGRNLTLFYRVGRQAPATPDLPERIGNFFSEQLPVIVHYITCPPNKGIEIDIVELDEEKSPQEELVEDMIAIVTSFSARIYGKRGGRVAKKLVQLIEQEVAAGEDHS